MFRASINRTLVYTALFVPLSVGGALAVALLLNARIRFSWFYRTAVFVPVATSTVATGIIFNWLLEPTYGVANYLLGEVGLGPYGFFQDPDQALYAIVAMTVWGWLGFDVIVYLAALQGIPQDLVEAARLDGAGRWATFRRVDRAAAGAGHAVFGGVVDHQCAAAVRRDLCDHPRRPAAVDDGGGLLPLPAGVPAVPRRLRGGDRVRAVPGSLVARRCCALARQVHRALQLVTRRRPFSPRHLVLLPLSPVMLLPLAWMLMTSSRRWPESRHFPPQLIPSGIHWATTRAWNAAPFGRWLLNSAVVTLTSVAGNLVLCSLAGYAFARLRFFGRRRRCSSRSSRH